MNKVNVTTTPEGDELVTLPRQDFEDLNDLLAHYAGLAEGNANPGAILTSDEMEALLDAPTPLVFWRRKRGLTQAALAAGSGVGQAMIAMLERGQRRGTLAQWKKLAGALGVKIDDLAA